MDIRKLCLLCLSFLSAFNVYAQAEKKDSRHQCDTHQLGNGPYT